MSSVSSTTTTTVRPTTVTAASVLLGILAMLDLLAAAIGMDAYGASFTISCIGFAAVRAVAAAGIWHRRRWTAILGFIITALDSFAFVPFIFDDSSVGVQVIAAIIVPLGVATLSVLAMTFVRRAYR